MGLKSKIDELSNEAKRSGMLSERAEILSFLNEDLLVLVNHKNEYPEGTLARAEIESKITTLHYVFKRIKEREM